MKKYLIPISLKSIKRNPDAGNYKRYIPGAATNTFECNAIPPFLKHDKNCTITDEIISTNGKKTYHGYLYQLTDTLIERIRMWIKKDKTREFNVSWSRDLIEVSSVTPEPDYLYNYKVIDVQCEECGHKFKSNEFEYDYTEDDEYFGSSDFVCPKCHAWACCDVSYETIAHALKRKKEKV